MPGTACCGEVDPPPLPLAPAEPLPLASPLPPSSSSSSRVCASPGSCGTAANWESGRKLEGSPEPEPGTVAPPLGVVRWRLEPRPLPLPCWLPTLLIRRMASPMTCRASKCVGRAGR